MGKLGDAIAAFMKVWRGEALVARSELAALEAAKATLEGEKQKLADKLKAAETRPDRFAEGAVYALLLLQREGRLVDFLQENLGGATDAQIGAAARQVHDKCQAVLRDSYGIAPVRTEGEGNRVEIPDGYDASAVKLTGQVPSAGPFKGTLVHKGWRAAKPHFPARTGKVDTSIVQPAEVEI